MIIKNKLAILAAIQTVQLSLMCCLLSEAYLKKKRAREVNRIKRRSGISVIFLNRDKYGASKKLVPKMRKYDKKKYFNFFRMKPEFFEELLQVVRHKITKEYVLKEPISARTRLEITLR
jgi:hypothetical protein